MRLSGVDKWNVNEFRGELQRIAAALLATDKVDAIEAARQDLEDLSNSLLIDYTECNCQVEVNWEQDNVVIDPNPECEEHAAKGKVEDFLIKEAVEKLREGKHLISCVPSDGYCRCVVETVEELLA